MSDDAWWKAIEEGDLESLRSLVKSGVDPNLRDGFGDTALHRLTCDEEEEPLTLPMARVLLEIEADVNAPDRNGQTPLMLVADCGDADMAELLLEHKPDLNMQDGDGTTALMLAVWHPEMARLLLDHGADPNARDSRGRAALMHAVERLNPASVRLLLERGADVDTTDIDGRSALHQAVFQSAELEASLPTLEQKFRRELNYAEGSIRWLRVNAETRLDIVRALVDGGANPLLADNKGMTSLKQARVFDATSVLDLLTQAQSCI